MEVNDCEIPFVGVVSGETERAARDFTNANVDNTAASNWLIDQLTLIDRARYKSSELMKIGSFAVRTLGDSYGFPVAFHNQELRDFGYLRALFTQLPFLLFPLRSPYEARLEVMAYDTLSPDFFSVSARDEVVVVATDSERILEDDDQTRDIRREGGGRIALDQLETEWSEGSFVFRLLSDVWGSSICAEITHEPAFDTRISSLRKPRWMLRLSRG